MEIGDWVLLKTGDAELIGYILEVYIYDFYMIITSKNDKWFGKKVRLPYSYPEYEIINNVELYQEDLVSIIDIALITKNKEWFLKLTEIMDYINTFGEYVDFYEDNYDMTVAYMLDNNKV